MKIAIIGAGMAGLSAARTLAAAGADCTVFDKSRGLGGRMATRRVNDLQFDHGAQYFTARGPRFQSRLAHWYDQGVVAEWLPGKWVGSPAMTAPARALAEGLKVIREYRVTTLAGGPGCWRLLSEDAPGNPIREDSFEAVVMALPAPQVAPLAASAGIRFIELERVRYAPCITLLLAFDEATGLQEASLSPPDGPIAWIARNNTKPGRSGALETLVVHATPEWSRAHLEDSDERMTDTLLRALRPYIGPVDPVFRMIHRWRFARLEQTAGVPYVWDPARQVGACGDWAGGPRVEAAFDSGEAMAAALLQTRLPDPQPRR
ncbi:FAD-dependent oxidoreductase [Wenzhouxiangella sp. XN24]|uniref:NAD(P)/FAD-dependent oxidoreductase n=1 Tax=Wenzhouxiangella sp. XN24 TaxID=2713569 RepID=UPI001981A79C|nr:FAD-dependent oxidoreductase [Wenzhouxiangella sp. XN24]